jgi:hypothetical protein
MNLNQVPGKRLLHNTPNSTNKYTKIFSQIDQFRHLNEDEGITVSSMKVEGWSASTSGLDITTYIPITGMLP